ncbi:MAG: FAD binding domain-containing protein [Promethearchaeota archaeon]|jgi:carbon-monoxide dehydrogenase medium subunit
MGYKFKPDQYIKPKSIRETIKILQKYGKNACIIAGGTDLLIDKPESAKVLVDIKGLGLSYVRNTNNGIAIGATTCFNTLIGSPLLQMHPYKVVSDAAKEIGHYNLRHIATIGGNICNAVPSADIPVALMVLDTDAVITGSNGERIIQLGDFFEFVRETVLEPGEFLKELVIPYQLENTAASFQKIGRTKVDIAIVNAACRLTITNYMVVDPRIILGAVGPTPIRAIEAENMLDGKEITPEIIEKVIKKTVEATNPITDHRASLKYRKEMSRVLIKQAILSAYAQLEGNR